MNVHLPGRHNLAGLKKEIIMRIIDLALKDLLQILRDWKAAFFLVLMPIGFTLLFGFIFTEQSPDSLEDHRLPVALVDQDLDLVGQPLFDLISLSETVQPIFPENGQTLDDLKTQVEDGDLAAVVVIPSSYTAELMGGGSPQLDLIINTETGAGTTAQWALQSAVSRLQKSVAAAQFSTQARAGIESFSDDVAEKAYFAASLEEAVAAWGSPPVTLASTYTGQDANSETETVNAFTHSSPGMMVQFAIAGLIGAAEVLVLERKTGSLRRLLTTPIRRYEILLGHYLAMVVMIFVQFVVLIVFAQVFLDVPYFSAPLGTFLVALSTAAFAAATGLLISTLAKTAEQVVVFSLIPMFILSGLGGAWMPLEFTGEAFQKVAYLTPLAWSTTAFKNIIERGQGLESVLMPVAIISGFAIIAFGLAAWRFKFEEA
jgi:ABC-2 type transport system permease protein